MLKVYQDNQNLNRDYVNAILNSTANHTSTGKIGTCEVNQIPATRAVEFDDIKKLQETAHLEMVADVGKAKNIPTPPAKVAGLVALSGLPVNPSRDRFDTMVMLN